MPWNGRVWSASAVAVVLFFLGHRGSFAEGVPSIPYNDDQALAELLWERAVDVVQARAALEQGRSALVRASTYPNPSLEGAWSTIPLGRTNPPGLSDRLDRVPNYSVALAELFEIAKRGPRIAARTLDVERLRGEALAVLGDRFFALLEAIGAIATNQRRVAVLEEQIRDGDELLNLDRARANRGEIAPLDVDVAEVEQARLRALRDSAEASLLQAQADCSALLSLPCPKFPDDGAAQAFLVRAYRSLPANDPPLGEVLQQRPDVKALEAAAAAAEQDAILAERRVIPDVTVRAGYTYDQFTISGNQRNSMAVGVELPLPVFDRGQADLMAARATQVQARTALQVLSQSIPEHLRMAREQLALALRRMEQLDVGVAKARAMRDTLVEAQHAGGISAIEVLVARRNYQDLVRERVELDEDAFAAALKIRKLTGSFPKMLSEESLK